MVYNKIKKEQGMTYLELIIATLILSVFLTVLYTAISSMTSSLGRQKNEIFPSQLANMIKDHYVLNTYEIDKNHSSIYEMPDISIKSRDLSTDVDESLLNMIDTVPYYNMQFRDGYNQPMLILISNLLEKEYEGVMIPYRVFSIVSTNNIDVMDEGTFKTTMDETTGKVNIDDEESVIIIDTFQEQLSMFNETKKKIKKISKAYSHYYWSRYNLEEGNIAKDYFAGGGSLWDEQAGTKVEKSCTSGSPEVVNGYSTPGVNILNTNFSKSLGIGSDFNLTDWGKPIYLMNCGVINNVKSGGVTIKLEPRNPDSSNAVRRTQPFNAIIGFTLPNGESYFEVISSRI